MCAHFNGEALNAIHHHTSACVVYDVRESQRIGAHVTQHNAYASTDITNKQVLIALNDVDIITLFYF